MKNFLTLFTLLILVNCGYQPLFSSKDASFSITQENYDQNSNSRRLKNNLKIYENNKNPNLYDLTLDTKENKTIILKDKKGNPSSYRLAITANLVARQNDKVILKKNYVKSFDYQNNVNKFDQTRYEKSLKNTLVDKISNEIIRDLLSIK
jgi:hypothetical protein|tara:strand:- start:125 stop:574 length:450 start_codon:yes stop_codon:yes gene_type:complete